MSSAKFVQKFKDMWNPPEDEFDDYDYDEQVEDVYEDEEPAEEYQEPARHSRSRSRNKFQQSSEYPCTISNSSGSI